MYYNKPERLRLFIRSAFIYSLTTLVWTTGVYKQWNYEKELN